MIPLHSERLRLELPCDAHAALIYESFASDPQVTRYLKWLPARSVVDSNAAMASRLERLAAGTELSWIVMHRELDRVIGSISLFPAEDEAELGFAFSRDFWGRGLARIWAACDVDNVRSGRVLEKLGMHFDRDEPGFAVHPALSSKPRTCRIFSVSKPADTAARIFHISTQHAWAQTGSEYVGDTLASEGFIHCSFAQQVMGVLDARFRGTRGLVLLEIDPAAVVADVRHEHLEAAVELFPHVYGPINREAIVAVYPLVAEPSGRILAPSVLCARS